MNQDRTLQELSSNAVHNRSVLYNQQHQHQRNHDGDGDLFFDEHPNTGKGHHHMQSCQDAMGYHSTINQPKMSVHNHNTRHGGHGTRSGVNHQHCTSVQYQGNISQKNALQRKSSKNLQLNTGNTNMTLSSNIGGSGFQSSRHLGGQGSQSRYPNTRKGLKSTTNQSQVSVNYNTQKSTINGGQSQVMQPNPSQSNFFGHKSNRSSRNTSREANAQNLHQAPTKQSQYPKKSATLKSQHLFKPNNTNQRPSNTNIASNSKYPKTLRTMSSKSGRHHENENEQVKSHRKFQLENGNDTQMKVSKVPKSVSPMQGLQQLSKFKISNSDLMQGLCMNGMEHPSRMLCRQAFDDFQRQNINVRSELSEDIDNYLRQYQHEFNVTNCLERHKITPTLRARMIDWMIEVLTNFKCDDQTFFLAVSLQDRFAKGCDKILEVGDLHVLGVTSMFVASKFEDIYPLKMKTVHEKIAHSKLDVEKIKNLELDIMRIIKYKIHAPTVLDFLKVYLLEALDIHIQSKTITKKKEEQALACNQELSGQDTKMKDSQGDEGEGNSNKKQEENELKVQQYLIEKMTIYLAKMSMHDVELCTKPPSLLAVGAIYVALKICEQLKRKDLINSTVVTKLIQVSHMGEDEILEVSQKVLYLAQNFDQEFPSLENLKKTHFGVITQLLCDEKYQNTNGDQQ